MESIFVGQLAALEDEGFFTAKLPGGKDVLILRCSGTVYAIQRRCPHEGAPLEKGDLWNKIIRCGQHAFTFDLETGEGLKCRGYASKWYGMTDEKGERVIPIVATKQPNTCAEICHQLLKG